MTIKTLKIVYYAQVYSLINQNIVVWGQSPDLNRIFIIQKRILRLMFNIGNRDSCREIFKLHKILTVSSIYLYKLLSLTFRNLENLKN